MSKNVYDLVTKNLNSYYIKYFSHVTRTYSGYIHEKRIKQEQRNGNLFTPEDFKAYVKTLKKMTKDNTDELDGVMYQLKDNLEAKQGQGKNLINERKLISNKLGVVSFIQATDQELTRKSNNIRTR